MSTQPAHENDLLLSTFSIVGRGPDGMLGVAVTSKIPAVGAHCPFVKAHTLAIGCQAYLNPYLAHEILHGATQGEPFAETARRALASDEAREWRQLIAIGPEGPPFMHTGAECDPWAGHQAGQDCAAAGNILRGKDTITALVMTFDQRNDLELPDRLLAALSAGQAAGGDRRGRQSAALLVTVETEVPYVNLRVDDHPDPVAELSRLHGLLSPHDLARARRVATSRIPRSVEEVRARQAAVQAALEKEGK